MATVRYLTHPQVKIDPAVPVPLWGLSERGRERAETLASINWLPVLAAIVSSAETKAVETAEILARPARLAVSVRERMHENDRSATGFLPPPEFMATAELFFAHPERSIRGWERAADAQARIVTEVEAALAAAPTGDVLLVGHGGVGRLLLSHLIGQAIPDGSEQADGGGNVFAFARDTRRLLHGWRSIEDEVAACGEPA